MPWLLHNMLPCEPLWQSWLMKGGSFEHITREICLKPSLVWITLLTCSTSSCITSSKHSARPVTMSFIQSSHAVWSTERPKLLCTCGHCSCSCASSCRRFCRQRVSFVSRPVLGFEDRQYHLLLRETLELCMKGSTVRKPLPLRPYDALEIFLRSSLLTRARLQSIPTSIITWH